MLALDDAAVGVTHHQLAGTPAHRLQSGDPPRVVKGLARDPLILNVDLPATLTVEVDSELSSCVEADMAR